MLSLVVQGFGLAFRWLLDLCGWGNWTLRSTADEAVRLSETWIVLELFLFAPLLGALLGYMLTAGWKNALLRRLSLPIIHPVEKAHDFAFGNDRAPGLVILTYRDGTTVRGYFGENSLAASDTDRSDLYLERLYYEDSDGKWSELDPPRSGLVSLTDVRTIEFLDTRNQTDAD